MPRATRNRKSSPVPAVQEEEEQELEGQNEEMDIEGRHVLRFDQDLTWRAGRPIVVAQLLRRLQMLYEELRNIEQEDADRSSTIPTAQELASQQLLAHRDNGVKAWTLLCIVEMFRLLAPDAPYKQSQLKEIFGLIVSTTVPALGNPSDPFNSQHLSILQSLVTVKSILLLQDAPGAERLILTLFQNCFDIISGSGRDVEGEQLSKNVEFYFTGMLTVLVDEGPPLSTGVTDVLLAQFLRADRRLLLNSKKGTAKSEDDLQDILPAYNMAKSVCNTCEDTMTRHIGTYFASVLVDAQGAMETSKSRKPKGKKRTHDESEDESGTELLPAPSDTELEEVAKAHRLLRELWKSCPGLVRNVVPQIEQEVGAENLPLRTLGVETLGDMIAGIGAAGPPPTIPLDPSAYPSQSLDTHSTPMQHNPLLMPAAPHAFSSVYPSTYQAFFDRHKDKSAQVRSAWAVAVGWIIHTSAGGKGLDREQESSLLMCLSDLLEDNDEKVRLAVIQAISQFDFNTILQKVGSLGGIATNGSLLANLANRIKDVKPTIRSAAIHLLGRIWGVAAGSIIEGREHVRNLLGWIPSRILEAVYVNDKNLNAIILRVMFESLLPIGFPPIKAKTTANGNSQRVIDSQSGEETAIDADKIRVERLLILVRDLEQKAKRVFFALYGQQQAAKSKYLLSLIDHSEKSKVSDDKSTERLLLHIASAFPDPSLADHQLSVFLEHRDRRNYSLVRFCVQPESEYRKVVNAMRELTKRLESAPSNVVNCLETVIAVLRQTSYLIYNRSHVPAIMDVTRRDDEELAAAAHEVLKEISANAPAVFKVHIRELCEALKNEAPSAADPHDEGAVNSLKTCAGFARHFPKDLGQDRDFYKAMTKFACQGTSPKAAKHAVTVLALCAEKKEMYIRDILNSCIKHFKYGEQSFLARLAALGQLRLVANEAGEEHEDAITEIVTTVLRSASNGDGEDGLTEDDELTAKLLSLKIFVNGVRGRMASSNAEEPTDDIKESANRVFRLLNTLVEKDGELSSTDNATPERIRVQLRLAAAKFILKLCCDKRLARLFAAKDFNRLTKTVQDESADVRAGISVTLEKYINLGKLDSRFYSLLFIYAFEPVSTTKERTVTFLKARTKHHARVGDQTMERVFGYFLSVLAHHPDFSAAAEDLEDFVEYLVFYLKIVSTEKNLPMLYNVAQRLKTVEDGIDPGRSRNLYVLSDLTEAVIRHFAELQGWSLQIVAAKARLPAGLYAPIPSHTVQEISEKSFLPAALAEDLEDKVRKCLKPKKRKIQDGSGRVSKKARTSKGPHSGSEDARKALRHPKSAKPTKTPKRSKDSEAAPSSERRKSTRASNARSYAENDDSEDDQELERWQAASSGDEDEGMNDHEISGHADKDANKENVASSILSSSPAIRGTTRGSQAASSALSKKRAAHEGNKEATPKQLPTRPGRTSARTAAAKAKNKQGDEFDVPTDDDE